MGKSLIGLKEYEGSRITKGELASNLYYGVTYDLAIPQGLADDLGRAGRSTWEFIVAYPAGEALGMLLPLTREAAAYLRRTAEREGHWEQMQEGWKRCRLHWGPAGPRIIGR